MHIISTESDLGVKSHETQLCRSDHASANDRLLCVAWLRRELGVSRATAYRMMNDGTLYIYRFGAKGRNISVSFARRCTNQIADVWTLAESHGLIVKIPADLAEYIERTA
jgi:hypothetical protein